MITVRRVSRGQLFAAFFFAVLLFLLYQVYLFVAPFAGPLVWAAILALTFYPLTTLLTRLFRGRRSLAAGVLVVAITAGVIFPAFFLGSALVAQATSAYGRAETAVRQGETRQLVEQLKQSRLGGLYTRTVQPLTDRLSIDPTDLLLRAMNWISNQFVGAASGLAKNALLSVVNFTLMLVALFFFFRDGEALAARLAELIPMDRERTDRIFLRLYTTLTAVVQSMAVTAVAQGVVSGIGYLLVGLPYAIYLAFLTGVGAFLPLAGPALVWGGTAIYLLAHGRPGAALFITVWGGGLVSWLDNFIKPVFIGGAAKLPTFPLLFAILGGISVYGFLGVFLGPVILAILLSFLDIYREEYREEPLPPPEAI
jgi:predicted PurR-regulated permease PerM